MTRKEATQLANAMNTIPSRLRIGAWTYKVDIVDEIKVDGEGPKMGVCHPTQHYIRIAHPHISSSQSLVGVFLHEIFHGIWDNQGLPNKAKEEDVVLAFHNGVTALFQDNPTLLDWIKKGLK